MADGNDKKWDRSEVERDALEKRKRRADGRRIQTESAETDRASEKSVENLFPDGLMQWGLLSGLRICPSILPRQG